MKTSFKLMLAGSLIFTLTGCATVATDSNQMVQISAEDKANNVVKDAKCTLRNKRGQWQVENTPGSAQVHKSNDNLLISCSKEGMEDGTGTLISRANAGFWGNIILGGGIGMLIDHNKGTAYTYPTWIKIIMGESLAFDRKEQKDDSKIVLGKPLTEDDLESIQKEKEALEEEAIKQAKLNEQ